MNGPAVEVSAVYLLSILLSTGIFEHPKGHRRGVLQLECGEPGISPSRVMEAEMPDADPIDDPYNHDVEPGYGYGGQQ